MIITPLTTVKELYENNLISIRAHNCLKYEGIENIQKLLSYIGGGNDICNIRNLGRKSELEISKVREQITFSQNNSYEDYVIELQIPDEIRQLFKDSLNQYIEQYNNCSMYFVDNFSQAPCKLYQNIKSFNNEFVFYKDLSKQDNILYRQTCCNFVEYFIDIMLKEDNVDIVKHIEKLTNTLEAMKNYISLKQCEELTYISEAYDKMLQQEFSVLCNKLGVRAANFINSNKITYKMLVPLFNKSLKEYNNQLCPNQSLKKTLNEIIALNTSFEEIFNRLGKLSDLELNELKLKIEYPFLPMEQRHFVMLFKEEHEHIPCFMLLYNYLRFSEERSDKLYCLYHGIFDNNPKPLNILAELYSLSRERVRQILYRNEINANSMFFCEDRFLQPYSILFKHSLIAEYSSSFKEIIDTEKLNISFRVFAALTSVLFGYSIETIGNRVVLLSNDLNGKVNIKEILNVIENVINGHYTKNSIINIDTFLENVPQTYKTEIREFVVFILQDDYGIAVSIVGDILLSKNCVDVESELISILEDNGRPMYLQELFERFNQIYPEHRASEPEKLRHHILRSTRLKAIGRQSLYGLGTWENVFFGSIPDFLVEILNESELPIQLDNIFKKVVDNFPNTTIKSIISFMYSGEDFIAFQDNYYGLKGRIYPADYIEQPIILRYKFEERISMFRDFVNTYKRYPFASCGDVEGSLQRWYYNVLNNNIEITEEQKNEFDRLIEKYKTTLIPQTEKENRFYNNCIEYKDFINKYHKLPISTGRYDLYSWFNRSKPRLEEFTDKRYKYMTDLIMYIQSFGFVI